MMNSKYILLPILILFLFACSDEYESIETIPNVDPPIELKTGSVNGLVTDVSGRLIPNATVQVIVNGTILHETIAQDGLFSFDNVGLHAEKTLIKAFTEKHSPNYKVFAAVENSNVELGSIAISPHVKSPAYNISEVILSETPSLAILVPANSLSNYTMDVNLFVQFFDFSVDMVDLYGIKEAVQDGKEEAISFSHGIFVEVFHDNNRLAKLKPEEDYTIRFSLPGITSTDEKIDIWHFDEKSALWEKMHIATLENETYSFHTAEFGHFAIEGEATVTMMTLDDLEDVTISTQPWTCVANYVFPALESVQNVTFSIDNNTYKTGDVLELDLGAVDVSISGTNADGETVTGKYSITIVDDVPPIPVCQDIIEVSFGQENEIELTAKIFDKGSHDAGCGPVSFSISRFSEELQLSDRLTFTKEDFNPDVCVVLRVTDDSGNYNDCKVTITLGATNDTNAPIPNCISNISTVAMGGSTTVEIWAADFNGGSTDDVTREDKLRFSFSGESYIPNRVFTCDDLQNGVSQEFKLEMWVWDEDGNKDYCKVTLRIEDKNNVCGGDQSFTVVCNDNVQIALDADNGGTTPNMFLEDAMSNPSPISYCLEIDGNLVGESRDIDEVFVTPNGNQVTHPIGGPFQYRIIAKWDLNEDGIADKNNSCWGSVLFESNCTDGPPEFRCNKIISQINPITQTAIIDIDEIAIITGGCDHGITASFDGNDINATSISLSCSELTCIEGQLNTDYSLDVFYWKNGFVIEQCQSILITIRDTNNVCANPCDNTNGDCDSTSDVALIIPDTEAGAGESHCIPITVRNFSDIVSSQIGITWDPSILSFVDYKETAFERGVENANDASKGVLRYIWIDATGGSNTVSTSDYSSVLEVCFDVIGNAGQTSTIAFTNPDDLDIEISKGSSVVAHCTQGGTFTVK